MRMWTAPVEVLCRQHLLGEHREMHMLVGVLNKRPAVSISGYLHGNLINPCPHVIVARHEQLVAEMLKRNPLSTHSTPLELGHFSYPLHPQAQYRALDNESALIDLLGRCAFCMQKYLQQEKWFNDYIRL